MHKAAIDVVSYMDRWARWAYGGKSYTPSLLQQIRQAKTELERTRREHTVACTTCQQEDPAGNVWSTGEVNGRTCHKCLGSGKRTIVYLSVNPASIPGTRTRGMNEDADPIAVAIDHLVASWILEDATVWLNIVAVIEYTSEKNLRQVAKARAHRMSQSFFSKKLTEVHERVADMLHERFGI